MNTPSNFRYLRWSHRLVYVPWTGLPVQKYVDNTVKYTNTVVGVQNPTYEDQIKKRLDASTVYDCQKFKAGEYYPPSIILTGLDRSKGYNSISCTGSNDNIQPPLGVAPTIPQSVYETAARHLYSTYGKIKDSPDSIPAIKEAKELKKLIVTPIESMFNLVESIIDLVIGGMPRKRKALRQLLDIASDLWLTWSFGASPTIMDVEASARRLASLLHEDNPVRRMSGTVTYTTKQQPNKVVDRGMIPDLVTTTKVYDHYVDSTVKYHFGVRLAPASSPLGVQGFCQAYALMPRDFVAAAWELIPFSWCIDYFINVGQFLNSQFVIKPDLVYGSLAVKNLHTIRTTWVHRLNSLYSKIYRMEQQSGLSELTWVTYNRMLLNEFPGEPLRFTVNEERENFGISKLLNLFSVLNVLGRK